MDDVYERFLSLAQRELSADDVRLLPPGEAPPNAANVVVARLRDGRHVVASFGTEPKDAEVLSRRLAMLAGTFADALDAPVGPQIDASLQRLQLDHADAFVFHGLSSMHMFEQLSQPGGGFAQLAACIKAGKVRFGGISSHHPAVLRAAITAGLCDIVMFPIGPLVDELYVNDILPLAQAHNVGTVCFKTFGAGKLLGDTAGYNQPLQLRPRGKLSSGGANDTRATLPRLSVAECLHYTLTLDPDVALLGLSYPNEQDQAFAAARSFAPLAPAQLADIRRRAIAARQGKGPCWWNPDPDA